MSFVFLLFAIKILVICVILFKGLKDKLSQSLLKSLSSDVMEVVSVSEKDMLEDMVLFHEPLINTETTNISKPSFDKPKQSMLSNLSIYLRKGLLNLVKRIKLMSVNDNNNLEASLICKSVSTKKDSQAYDLNGKTNKPFKSQYLMKLILIRQTNTIIKKKLRRLDSRIMKRRGVRPLSTIHEIVN